MDKFKLRSDKFKIAFTVFALILGAGALNAADKFNPAAPKPIPDRANVQRFSSDKTSGQKPTSNKASVQNQTDIPKSSLDKTIAQRSSPNKTSTQNQLAMQKSTSNKISAKQSTQTQAALQKLTSDKQSISNQQTPPNAQSALEKYLSAPETGSKQDSSQDASKDSNPKAKAKAEAKAPTKIYRLDRSKIQDINQKRLDGQLDSNFKAGPSSFSFDALLEHTLANSPSLNLTRLDVQSARNELEYQKASRYPELGINANSEYAKRYGARYNSVQIGDDSLVSQSGYGDSVSLVLRQDIFKFGADELAIEAAEENIKQADLKRCSSYMDSSIKLLELYDEALGYKNRIEIYERLKDAYEMLYIYEKRLSGAGELSKTALADQAIALADTSYELSQLELNANNVLNKIYSLSGVKIPNVFYLSDLGGANSISSDFVPFEDSVIAKGFDHELAANELSMRSQERLYYPTVSLYGRYDLYGSDRDDFSRAGKDVKRHGYRAGLTVHMSLFDGGKRAAQIKEKQINKERILSKKEEAKLEYEKQIADLKLFLSKKDEYDKILSNSSKISKDILTMQKRLNAGNESSKIDVLNSLIASLKKELALKEHAQKASFNIKKAELMSRYGRCE
ncbi:TolC family protein [uncultured Campylobacter sp.]|mgnify:CR=1 FL=1|uniref:TolC family protein n=1 Tax=uncultured Campylobacter sp. TaxID=218934 RepID=UPI00261FCF64|nr:TolC family protein [uncultured Campylobacter sp.]